VLADDGGLPRRIPSAVSYKSSNGVELSFNNQKLNLKTIKIASSSSFVSNRTATAFIVFDAFLILLLTHFSFANSAVKRMTRKSNRIPANERQRAERGIVPTN
jgi:hypothetical protein